MLRACNCLYPYMQAAVCVCVCADYLQLLLLVGLHTAVRACVRLYKMQHRQLVPLLLVDVLYVVVVVGIVVRV